MALCMSQTLHNSLMPASALILGHLSFGKCSSTLQPCQVLQSQSEGILQHMLHTDQAAILSELIYAKHSALSSSLSPLSKATGLSTFGMPETSPGSVACCPVCSVYWRTCTGLSLQLFTGWDVSASAPFTLSTAAKTALCV